VTDPQPDHPGVVEPPPFLFLGTLAAGLLLDRALPLPFVPKAVSRIAGTSSLLKGVVIFTWAFRTMKGAGTNVDVAEPATSLVASGPYAYSRNPIYLGLALVYGGLATLSRAPITLALLAPLLAVMQRGVVEREERYLERKFGASYVAYKSRVRRWF
jgi:protein-S-isoprenylcysteine O-methyltransferase Ste14